VDGALRTKTEKEFEEGDGRGNWKRRTWRERERDMTAAAGNRVRWRCFMEVLSADLA
jgi:hypothetical protein